jgi:hypothetical protein
LAASCLLTSQLLETETTRPFWDFVNGQSRGEMDCFATLTRNKRLSR